MEKYKYKTKKTPTVAPGMEGNPKGEMATPEDKKTGNVTKVTRLVWDENDPS